MSDRLLEMLREHSYVEGEVRLSSGKVSDFFIDCKQTVLLADGHVAVGERMLEAIGELSATPRAVAGVELGGCSLASAVALISAQRGQGLDAIYVRKTVKEHGSKRALEGDSHLDKGTSVVVLEDVVTTGGSTLRAVASLREAGYDVSSVIAIVDRCEGGAETLRGAGLEFVALYTRHDFVAS